MPSNSNLDELAAAAENEPGDAAKAWRLLAAGIDTTNFPTWVKDYFRNSAGAVAHFDLEKGDPARLARDLGFHRETSPLVVGYDRDHLFDWFTERMMEDLRKGAKVNIARLSREYYEKVMNHHGTPDGVRKAYESVRKAHRARLAAEEELAALLAVQGR